MVCKTRLAISAQAMVLVFVCSVAVAQNAPATQPDKATVETSKAKES